MLNNHFILTYQQMLDTYLINERNNELRFLFLEKLQEFYEDQEDSKTCNLMEQVFAKNVEVFFGFGSL